jgi:hypothetical protein
MALCAPFPRTQRANSALLPTSELLIARCARSISFACSRTLGVTCVRRALVEPRQVTLGRKTRIAHLEEVSDGVWSV